MDVVHLGVWFAASFGMALLTLLLFRGAIRRIVFDLFREEIGGSYISLLIGGLFFVSVASGVGTHLPGYVAPTTSFGWFATTYNAAFASGIAIFTHLAVVIFVCFVSHISLVRARISSGGK
jgi:hypothetical protein